MTDYLIGGRRRWYYIMYVSNTSYFITTDTGGFLPKAICDDLVLNRVGNVHGGAGKNVGLDLVNEFLNNDFNGEVFNFIYTLSDYEVCMVY